MTQIRSKDSGKQKHSFKNKNKGFNIGLQRKQLDREGEDILSKELSVKQKNSILNWNLYVIYVLTTLPAITYSYWL